MWAFRRVLPVSFATALLVAAPRLSAGFSGTDVFIPASARAAGVAPAQFYSTLWLTNLSPATVANVQLKFFQRDVSNTSPVTVPFIVNPGETKKFENVVQTIFGLSSASGAIRIQSDQEILASSRTYDLPPGADIRNANGLFFSGVPRSFAIGAGETAELQGISVGSSEDFRYSFGFVEVAGSPITVRIDVRNPDGTTIGTKDYPVQAYEAKQFLVTDAAPGISTVNGRIEARILSGSGQALIYGTSTANGSQDSIGFEMSFKTTLLSGGGVTTLNGFTGAVTILAGTNVNLTTAGGNTIVINSTAAGGGGLTLPYTGSASTGGGNAAFAVGNSGAGPAIIATSNGAGAITGSVPGTVGSDHAIYGVVTSASPAGYSSAVRGQNNGTGGLGIGVHGSQSGNGWGVLGQTVGGFGVYGSATSAGGVGVYADSPSYAVKGQLTPGGSGLTIASGKAAIWGDAKDEYGVFGSSSTSAGVTGASSTRYGVQALGFADGNNGAALFAYSSAGSVPVAAYFGHGSVTVNGALSKSSGSFKIDHPLDPENKYLYHSFVESPDMKNIYDGLVALDAHGEAVIELPDWFSALNRDFRYQLTCVGGYAPVYIAREVENGTFRIAGGRPGLKVSWQVTGIRQDAWANAHRIPVEEMKDAAERGSYLHPELFGQPEEKGVEWVRYPEEMKAIRANRERIEAARRAAEGH